MPKYNVRAPDGKSYVVNAPEGATEQDAIAYIARSIYKIGAKPAKRDALGAGIESAKSGLTTGLPYALKKAIGKLTPEEEATYLKKLRESEAKSEALLPGGAPSASDVFSGKASVGRFLGENIGQMAPQVGASIAGGIAGSLVGPEGTVAGIVAPLAGGALAATPLYVGSNVERATESGEKALDRAAAFRSLAAAPAQATVEVVGERFLPGVGRIFGAPAAKTAGKFIPRTLKGAARGAAEEAITEPLQQVGERYAAGVPLTDEEARGEYLEAATTAGLLGGALGGAGAQFQGRPRDEGTTGPTDISSEAPAREGFTDTDISARLATSLGDVEPDKTTTTFTNAIRLKLSNDLALDNPDSAEAYVLRREQQIPLQGKKYPQEQRDAQQRAVDEARSIINDYYGARQQEAAGATDGTTTAPGPDGGGDESGVPDLGGGLTGEPAAASAGQAAPVRVGLTGDLAAGIGAREGVGGGTLAQTIDGLPRKERTVIVKDAVRARLPEGITKSDATKAVNATAQQIVLNPTLDVQATLQATLAKLNVKIKAAPVVAAPVGAAPEVVAPTAPKVELTPETYVDRYVAGEGRGNTPADLEMQQFAENERASINAEFIKRKAAEDAVKVAPTAPVAKEVPEFGAPEQQINEDVAKAEVPTSELEALRYEVAFNTANNMRGPDAEAASARLAELESGVVSEATPAVKEEGPPVTYLPEGTARGVKTPQRDLPSMSREEVETTEELTQEQVEQIGVNEVIRAARDAGEITNNQEAQLRDMMQPQFGNPNRPEQITRAPLKAAEVRAKLKEFKKLQRTSPEAQKPTRFVPRIEEPSAYERSFSDKAIAKITANLQKRLEALGLSDVYLSVTARRVIEYMTGEEGVVGTYEKNLIQAAYDSDSPYMTLTHEAVHAMRDLGLFTDREWSVLTAQAKRQGVMAWAKKNYADKSAEEQLEEAVAEMFARWSNSGRPRGPLGTLYGKIVKFLRALYATLKDDAGYKDAAAVMQAIEGGAMRDRTRAPIGEGDIKLRNAGPNNSIASILNNSTSLQSTLKPFFSEFTRKFNYKYQDFVDFSNQLAAALGLDSLPEAFNVKRKIELFESRKGGAQQLLDKRFFIPIMKRIRELKLDPQDVGMYLWARSAADRNKMVAEINADLPEGGSGLTTAEAKNVLDTLDRAGLTANLKEVAALHDRLVDHMLREKVKAGLLTKEDADALRAEQPYYTPLKGFAADGDMMVPGDDFANDKDFNVNRRLGIGSMEYMRAKGRTTMPLNPLTNLFADAQMGAERIEKQRVGLTFLEALQAYPTETANIAKIYTNADPEISSQLRDPSTGQVVVSRKKMYLNSKEYLLVKKDGEVYYIKFQPTDEGKAMKRAFTNMTPVQMGTFMKGWGAVNNALKKLLTTRNPAYLLGPAILRDISDAVASAYAAETEKGNPAFGKRLGNRVRDYVLAPSTANAVRKYVAGIAPSTMEEMRLADMLDQMIEDGGSAGYALIKDAETFARDAANKLRDFSKNPASDPLARGKQALDAVGNALDSVAEGIDLQARFATYRAAIELGIGREGAASLALNSSLNLTRRGEWARILDNYVFFFSPTVEGARKLVKMGLTPGNGVKVMATMAAVGAMSALWNNSMSGDDDEDGRKNYLDVNNTTRMTRLVMYFGPGADDYVAIPVGFMLAYPKYVGEKIMEAGLGISSSEDASTAIMNATVEITKGFLQATSPVRASGDQAQEALVSGLLPSILKPFGDVGLNRNFFGSPIYNKQFDSSRAKSDMGRENTGDFWKWAAKSLNEATGGLDNVSGYVDFQPEAYRYLVESFGGGVYRTARDIANMKPSDESKGLQVKDIPVARSFVGKGSEYVPINRYYDNTAKMDAFMAGYRHDTEEEWAAKQQKFPLETDMELLEAYYEVDKYKDKISDARKDALAELSGSDPRRKEIIDAAREMQAEAFMAYNELYNEKKRALGK